MRTTQAAHELHQDHARRVGGRPLHATQDWVSCVGLKCLGLRPQPSQQQGSSRLGEAREGMGGLVPRLQDLSRLMG